MSKKFSKSSSTKLLTTNPSQGWGFRVSDDKSKEKFRLYFFKLIQENAVATTGKLFIRD